MATPTSIDDYLATVPEGARAALERLRKTIRAAAPEATESISYGVPAFKHHGPLVSFGAAQNHCAFYVMSPAVMDAHQDELKNYDTSKGILRFPADKPLRDALVRKLVMARIRENESRRAARDQR